MLKMEKNYTVYRVAHSGSFIEYGSYTQEITALQAIDDLLRSNNEGEDRFTILPTYQLKGN